VFRPIFLNWFIFCIALVLNEDSLPVGIVLGYNASQPLILGMKTNLTWIKHMFLRAARCSIYLFIMVSYAKYMSNKKNKQAKKM